MRITILLFFLIFGKSIFAKENSKLSAKFDYQNALKKNEKTILIFKQRKEQLETAENRYKLAQDNLKSAKEQLIAAENNFEDAQQKLKESKDILKKSGKHLDEVYLKNTHYD